MSKDGRLHRLLLLTCDARRRGVLQFLEVGDGGSDVAQQHVGHIAAEALAHHDTHHYAILDILGHGVGRYHPSALFEFVLQVIERPLGILRIAYIVF